MRVKANSQKFLKKYVLDEGLCTDCGACVGLCPYQAIYHDRTVQLHNCDLEDGKCYAFCPRTATDLAALRKHLFEPDNLTLEIGAVKGYYFSQATDPELRKIAQHGATVTALIEVALAEGLIDSAIVSSRNEEFMQNGAIINDRGALRKNAGSKFTVSPTVAAFNQLVTEDRGTIGVVTTPCQALALAKMKLVKEDNPKIGQLKLVIGLYCGWTLSAEKYTKLLLEKNISPESITKMDIPAGKNILELFTNNGVKSIPFDEVQECIRPSCNYCLDSTAEYADVSVGSACFAGDWEDVRQWNQLIVRTAKGRELVDLAVKRGVLEIREAPAESLKELKDAAEKKKKEALKNIIKKSGSVKKLLYLDSHDPVVKKYLEVRGKNRTEKKK
ncbi:MAG: Coenzyme F420 hydrogenase/dehydrogenase, beta subunit C-terminal domain [Deltaproteobacteria bacterium]|nr:Coenzyme F420 hydrogenase/dehydrogenase, beta subunit C-terminal domain [Deltaproteobacteria bacterium]